MGQIVDYGSCVQAIADFCHRADIATGLYTDYLIQSAIEKIQDDTFAANFGNGVMFMENAYGPLSIQGGTAPVPDDWMSPKAFQVADGSGDVFTLIFKSAAWLYDQYPIRQPAGLPSYIARDVMAPCSFIGSLSPTLLTVTGVNSGILQVGMVIDGVSFPTNPLQAVTITGQNQTTGLTGTYPISNPSPVVSGSLPLTGGGNVFIFGPYPDSVYTLQGTYYQQASALNSTNTTNWMVTNQPAMLHAAAMIQAGLFLIDDVLVARWTPIYEGRLASFVLKDKAERWAASTMQIEIG